MSEDSNRSRVLVSFSLSAIDALFRSVWDGQVSQEAKELFRESLDFHAREIAQKAVTFCRVRGGKRVSDEDVRLATQWYFSK